MSDVEEQDSCGPGGGSDTYFNIRVAAIFVILISSSSGALFPVLSKRVQWMHVPEAVFNFAKYFGSGVIVCPATLAHFILRSLTSSLIDCYRIYPFACPGT